jgi:hypothetical protein
MRLLKFFSASGWLLTAGLAQAQPISCAPTGNETGAVQTPQEANPVGTLNPAVFREQAKQPVESMTLHSAPQANRAEAGDRHGPALRVSNATTLMAFPADGRIVDVQGFDANRAIVLSEALNPHRSQNPSDGPRLERPIHFKPQIGP